MDYLEAPAWKLDERAKLLTENRYSINYGPERARQVKVELGMIALEILCRQLENHGHEPAEAIQGLGIDYFGYNAEPKGQLLGRATINLSE